MYTEGNIFNSQICSSFLQILINHVNFIYNRIL